MLCHEIEITLLKKKHETNFKKISKLSNKFEKKNKLIKKKEPVLVQKKKKNCRHQTIWPPLDAGCAV
jgi:hypothetical protein